MAECPCGLPPKFGDGAFSVQLVTQRACAKEQEGSGSEGIRQWHREEPELGTAPAQEDTGNLQTEAGIFIRGSKLLIDIKLYDLIGEASSKAKNGRDVLSI